MKHIFSVCMLMLMTSHGMAQSLYLGGGVEKAEFISMYDYFTESTDMEIATVIIGYELNQYFGVEAQVSTGLTEGKWSYSAIGSCGPDNCYADTSVDSIIGVYAAGTLPISNRLSLIVKGGYSSSRGDIDLGTNNSEGRLDQNGLSYGAGLRFRLLEKSDIQLLFMKTVFSDNDEKMDYLKRIGVHFHHRF